MSSLNSSLLISESVFLPLFENNEEININMSTNKVLDQAELQTIKWEDLLKDEQKSNTPEESDNVTSTSSSKVLYNSISSLDSSMRPIKMTQEEAMRLLHLAASLLQANIKRYFQQKRYQSMISKQRAAIKIQAMWRGYRTRNLDVRLLQRKYEYLVKQFNNYMLVNDAKTQNKFSNIRQDNQVLVTTVLTLFDEVDKLKCTDNAIESNLLEKNESESIMRNITYSGNMEKNFDAKSDHNHSNQLVNKQLDDKEEEQQQQRETKNKEGIVKINKEADEELYGQVNTVVNEEIGVKQIDEEEEELKVDEKDFKKSDEFDANHVTMVKSESFDEIFSSDEDELPLAFNLQSNKNVKHIDNDSNVIIKTDNLENAVEDKSSIIICVDKFEKNDSYENSIHVDNNIEPVDPEKVVICISDNDVDDDHES